MYKHAGMHYICPVQSSHKQGERISHNASARPSDSLLSSRVRTHPFPTHIWSEVLVLNSLTSDLSILILILFSWREVRLPQQCIMQRQWLRYVANILSNELRRASWMEKSAKAWQGTSLFKCLEPHTVPLMSAWPFNVPVKIHDGVLLSLHHGIEVKLWMRHSLPLTHIPSLSVCLYISWD